MEANVSSIKGLIQNGRLLRIPYFQRSYVWREYDWERFAKDMESTLSDRQDYFLGAVILKDEQKLDTDARNGIEQRCMVVDGQQRLTTLSIYMKVLYTLAGQNEMFNFQYLRLTSAKEPVIEHSREDRHAFEQVMHQETAQKINNRDDNNIIKAYEYFLSRLLPYNDQPSYLTDLINTINAQIRFVVITLNNTDDEQQIFDTINSLGVPLTTSDLVKNFLYGPDDEKAYNENWRPVFEATKEIRDFWLTDASKSRQEKTKENCTIERFFHAFVRIKMWDYKDQLTDSQKKLFVKSSNVFSTCKAFHEIFNTDKQALANEIIEYAKIYREHLREEILDDDGIPMNGGIKRISCFINATKQYSVIPYVLYILRNVPDETERNKIFDYLETYLVRRILCESNNGDYSGLFAEYLIGNSIKTYESLREYIGNKDTSFNLSMPSNSNIKLDINTRRKPISENLAQIIYYLYETRLAGNQINKSYNDYYIQMLMPKQRTANSDNWPRHRRDTNKEEERCRLITSLGNYFLLNVSGEKPLKKKFDEQCSVKVDEMRKWSENIRSNQLLSDIQTGISISEWNAESIMSRNRELARIFCEHIWVI